jgi:hypothetical protein
MKKKSSAVWKERLITDNTTIPRFLCPSTGKKIRKPVMDLVET